MTIDREPQSVHASLTYDKLGVDDFVNIHIIFEGGIHADLVASFGLHSVLVILFFVRVAVVQLQEPIQ